MLVSSKINIRIPLKTNIFFGMCSIFLNENKKRKRNDESVIQRARFEGGSSLGP